MNINPNDYRTKDGYPFEILATELTGNYPVLIRVNGTLQLLDSYLQCPTNDGYSLVAQNNVTTKYYNLYRAADGSVCIGRSAFKSNNDRLATRDSGHSLFGLKLTVDEQRYTASAELC